MKALLPVVFATAVAFAQSPVTGPADAIYYHGHILTGEGLQQDKPVFVTALAIRGGKILETGTDTEVLKFAGDKTAKVDLGGAFVMPGFNDAHVHLGSAGLAKITVDLIGVSSLEEMTKRVHNAAIASPSGHWLVGFGWDPPYGQRRLFPHARIWMPLPGTIPLSSRESIITLP
jgi:predicted amidohydrolase YtcJ